MQAHKPHHYLRRCACGSAAFHYDYERNVYLCVACGRQVAGCTAKRKS